MNLNKKGMKVLIINGHPNPKSLCNAFAKAYKESSLLKGNEVKELVISELNFNPNLKYGYQERSEWETDLQLEWDTILWADHLVWIHPVWWGGLPAILKGFIDRVFLPGKAFKYRGDSLFWDKLLKGKTGHIICTLDQPGWYYWLVYGKPSVNQLKKSTLEFCGIKPVKVNYFGIVRKSSPEKRKEWIEKVKLLARAS